MKTYAVTISGVEHTLQLDAEDVARYPGAKPVEAKAARSRGRQSRVKAPADPKAEKPEDPKAEKPEDPKAEKPEDPKAEKPEDPKAEKPDESEDQDKS